MCSVPLFNNVLQVENLTRKAQLQEIELERTTKQLKEAIAIAGEETAKCEAAKEVIKSLTAQVRFWFMFADIKDDFTVLADLSFALLPCYLFICRS